ncbi:MAG TPA: four helix bundle protein [Flavipsychrobacter sp.]|nr:four helix bundle protein [Flavipsychrobacter sp.]
MQDKSYLFAISVVRLYQHLSHNKNEFVLSKQLLRSGTAVGALIAEANFAQTKPDFITKLSIAAKEAQETTLSLPYSFTLISIETFTHSPSNFG